MGPKSALCFILNTTLLESFVLRSTVCEVRLGKVSPADSVDSSLSLKLSSKYIRIFAFLRWLILILRI